MFHRAKTCKWLAFLLALVWIAAGLKAAPDVSVRPGDGDRTPAFSPASGVYVERVTVQLSAKSGLVRYTTDGSEPTGKSSLYAKPVVLKRTSRLRARVFSSGQPAGPILEQSYVIADAELERFTSNLPLLVIHTSGAKVGSEDNTTVAAWVKDTHNSRSALVGPADFAGPAEIHYRGKSSLRYLKRSYALGLLDPNGKALKAGLLGLPPDDDWVLYAPYPDKTLMRDVVGYEIFGQMGHYQPRTRFVEVFVNENGGSLQPRDYMGVFVLVEKIKRGKNRVNIQKMDSTDNEEPDVAGGYIFKKDKAHRIGPEFATEAGWPTMGGTPSRSTPGFPSGPGGFPGDPRGFVIQKGNRIIPSEGVIVTLQDGNPVFSNRLSAPAVVSTNLEIPRSPKERKSQPEEPPMMPFPDAPPMRGPSAGEVLRMLLSGSHQQMSQQIYYAHDLRPGFQMVDSGEEVFVTRRTNHFFYVEPKARDITFAQKTWLLNHLNEFERSLYGPDFKDPLKGYPAYLDVDSFIDHHLIVEVTKNIDGFRFSTFFHKDRGGKLAMGPIWDWNLSLGNANGKQGWLPEYWYWPQLDDEQYLWFRRLFEDPDFGQRYVDRWSQLRASVLATSNVLARIDTLAAFLDESQKRNFTRWPILGKTVWPNKYVGRTYEDEVRWMKQWTGKRLAWIEKQFLAAPLLATNSAGGVELAAPEGTVFYTLDGSDPRAPGGMASATAQAYSAPVRIAASDRLFARVRSGPRWSSPLKTPQ